MAKVQLNSSHGSPVMVDYTPSGAVAAGDIIVFGSGVRIAHSDIAAGIKGAVAIGGGVYEFPCLSATTIAVGLEGYWDVADAAINGSPTGNTFAGTLVRAKLNGETTCLVAHQQPATVGA